jgi:hypothetical protein
MEFIKSGFDKKWTILCFMMFHFFVLTMVGILTVALVWIIPSPRASGIVSLCSVILTLYLGTVSNVGIPIIVTENKSTIEAFLKSTYLYTSQFCSLWYIILMFSIVLQLSITLIAASFGSIHKDLGHIILFIMQAAVGTLYKVSMITFKFRCQISSQ